jgi:hydrogenase-4 component H
MFEHAISELKEALLCLRAGQVTLGYPFEPHPPEPGFRGLPHLDVEKCIGCGACANACPPRLITLHDGDGYRTLDFYLARCTYCARCRDVCPQEALTMSDQFETATPSLDDLHIVIKLKLIYCRECGAVVGTQRSVDKVLAEVPEQLGLPAEEMDWLDLCLDCKREKALRESVPWTGRQDRLAAEVVA